MIVEENAITQHPILPHHRNTYYWALERAFLNTQIFTISKVQCKWIHFFFQWYKTILLHRCNTKRCKLPKDRWHSVPSWTPIFCCIKLPTLKPLPFKEQIHLKFSNQLQSSPGSHSIRFSTKKKGLMFCMRCTHNPGSTFLRDAVFFC